MSQLAPLSLPSELLAKLPSVADLSWHVRLLAGLSSLVGETHLVGARDGSVRVYSRSSMLAPFDELAAVTSLRITRGTLRTELLITSAAGTHTLPLGYREVDELAGFLDGDERSFTPPPVLTPAAGDGGDHAPTTPETTPGTEAITSADVERAGPISSSYTSAPWTSASVPTTAFVPSPAPLTGVGVSAVRVPSFVVAPPDPAAPTATDQWALRRAREDFVNTLAYRVAIARPRPAATLPRFAKLLDGPTPRATRRALLDARLELEQGRTQRALALLEDAAIPPRWQVRVALAEVLHDLGRSKDALSALKSADQVGAPGGATFEVRERAARATKVRRALLLALRHKRHLDPTLVDRWEIDREIRALEAEGEALRKQSQAREAKNRAEKDAATQTRAERKRAERSTRPPSTQAPKKRPRKVKKPVDPRIPTLMAPGQRALQSASMQRDLAAVRRARAKGNALSNEVKPDADSTWWLLAAAVLLIAFAFFLYVRSNGFTTGP